MLERLLNSDGGDYKGRTIPCDKGHVYVFKEYRDKMLLTVYFDKNKKRMRYADFMNQGFFVGSGVLEAGCRAVIGQRLKQSGMHWTVKRANNIIALRYCFFSNRWEDF